MRFGAQAAGWDVRWRRSPRAPRQDLSDGTEAGPDLSLEIPDGELMVLVGPSGCGKTTTLRMVAGLEDTTAGNISIGDRVVTDLPPRERDIAMVFQNYALYPHKTVFDNLAFPLKLRDVAKDEIEQRVKRIARMLDLEQLPPEAATAVRRSAAAWRWAAPSSVSRRRSSWTSHSRISMRSFEHR